MTEPGNLTFRVRDEFCPWNEGVYLLQAGVDGAECTRVGEQSADRTRACPTSALRILAVLSFSDLARAGRVKEHAPGALASADRVFRTERQRGLWSCKENHISLTTFQSRTRQYQASKPITPS